MIDDERQLVDRLPCVANGYHTLGRSTLIEPMNGRKRLVPYRELPLPLSLRSRKSNMDWNCPMISKRFRNWAFSGLSGKNMPPKSLTFKEDILWMKAKGRTSADGRVLLTTAEDKITKHKWKSGQGMEMWPGLSCIIMKGTYAGVVSDGKRFYIYRNAEHKTELPNRIGKHLPRLHNCGNTVCPSR